MALKAFLAAVWQAARRLGLEITGFLFAVFAVVFATAGVREWRAAAGEGPTASVLAALLALLFGYFAVSSFMRARR